jgi:metal-responsive CopG/Arc/MetJ family transcriptional regulator
MRYIGSMKKKTSITLSEDLLEQLDRTAGPGASRSAYIERVLRRHFRRRARAAEQARDLEILNGSAQRLNADMASVLEFQAPWSDDG